MADSLLRRVATGETVAVEQCIERYGGLVWSLARRFSGTPSDADDAVQEIFIDLWRSASRFDESVASEATFVSMIARRRLVDRYRDQGRRPETIGFPTDLAAREPGVSDQIELGDEVARISQAMNRLRPEQQQVLRMSIYDGLSHDEIAKSIGIPLGTVKTHARRGLMHIREAVIGEIRGSDKEGSA